MKFALKLSVALCLLAALACTPKNTFVQTRGGQFVRNGKPYHYIGTNFWYGPILASDTPAGDWDRLTRELDTLKALGMTNLRVLVGAQGQEGVFSRVEPTLEQEPGVYNEALLTGLDRFLAELGKRDMQAVLYLNNSWEWSGGYGQYLEWATGEKALIPLVDGYWPFMQQMRRFQTCTEAQELFYAHVRAIVGRTNSITGKPYKEDPAIFSWQIGNEPRCFSSEKEIQDGFIAWLTESARIIKELDPNHLDIETSWLALECAFALKDLDVVNRVRPWALRMGRAGNEGLLADGSLRYEKLPDGGYDDSRQWWVQAETVVGNLWLWKYHSDAGGADRALRAWNYIKEHLVDSKDGEWWWAVLPDGSLDKAQPKAGFWKCPYHNTRMCLQVLQIFS